MTFELGTAKLSCNHLQERSGMSTKIPESIEQYWYYFIFTLLAIFELLLLCYWCLILAFLIISLPYLSVTFYFV